MPSSTKPEVYITYANAARRGPSRGHRQRAQKVEVRLFGFRVMRAERQTDRHARDNTSHPSQGRSNIVSKVRSNYGVNRPHRSMTLTKHSQNRKYITSQRCQSTGVAWISDCWYGRTFLCAFLKKQICKFQFVNFWNILSSSSFENKFLHSNE